MPPQFPQEIFDYIIDYSASDFRTLRKYSTVCKSWSVRSRSHLLDCLRLYSAEELDLWCKNIPPTTDGPSRFVNYLYMLSGVIPLVFEPQSLDPYLAHFSALTRVDVLELVDHRGTIPLDMFFQCFSVLRHTLKTLKVACSSLAFDDISRMVEYFPNLTKVEVWGPTLNFSKETGPFPPPRQTSFPRLKTLFFRVLGSKPELGNNILSGFAKASKSPEVLSLVGEADVPIAQELLDSSAHSLLALRMSPLDLDLSACEHLEILEVEELLFTYVCCVIYESFNKHRFEGMLRTIKSPTFDTINVHIIQRGFPGDEEDLLPKYDWTDVDGWVCELLERIRGLNRDPSWTITLTLTGCELTSDGIPPYIHPPWFLPKFQAMGGVVNFSDIEMFTRP